MNHNKFSWIQTDHGNLFKFSPPSEHLKLAEDQIRDFNVGTQNLRFKVVAVEHLRKWEYRITLDASTSAIRWILALWSDGQWYNLNGKKMRT